MTVFFRLLSVLLLGTGLLASSSSSFAQEDLRTFLVGKTCFGSFDSGNQKTNSKGGFRFKFSNEAPNLSAQMWSAFGEEAFKDKGRTLPLGQPVTSQRIEIDGLKVLLVTPSGVRFDFQKAGTGFVGEVDARPRFPNASVGKAEFGCE